MTAGLGGCATMNGLSDKFDIASRSYNRALRWDDLDSAMTYLPPESVAGFLAERDVTGDSIKIVDYDRVRVQVDQKLAQGFVRVMLQWHYDDSVTVETCIVDQVWQYHNGDWTLVEEWQIKGTPLFLFAEYDEDHPDAPHPYLPGLASFRETRMIGLSDTEKRKRIREAKRSAHASASGDLPAEDGMPENPAPAEIGDASFDTPIASQGR